MTSLAMCMAQGPRLEGSRVEQRVRGSPGLRGTCTGPSPPGDQAAASPLAQYHLCDLAEPAEGKLQCNLPLGLFAPQTHYLNPRAQAGVAGRALTAQGLQKTEVEYEHVSFGQKQGGPGSRSEQALSLAQMPPCPGP